MTKNNQKPEEKGDGFFTYDDHAVASVTLANGIPTEEYLIEKFKIDLVRWEPDRYVTNCWDVTVKLHGNFVETYRNYQGKLTLKPRPGYDDSKIILEEFIAQSEKFVPKLKSFNYPKPQNPDGACLLEVNCADVHLEQLAWAEETGTELCLESTCKLFTESIETILARSSGFEIDRILYPIGNDFFNSDNHNNSTSRGTPQECSAVWRRAYRAGQDLLVNSIERLRKIAPVDIVVIPGNHDMERMFYIGEALRLWFSKVDGINVTVDNRACGRKYYRYHKNLIGFSHGKEKETLIPAIMAQESDPEDWAQTKFREMHLAHTHHKKDIKYISTDEHTGIVIRRLQALTGTDEWLYGKGFIGAGRGATGFVWSKNSGLVSQVYSNI